MKDERIAILKECEIINSIDETNQVIISSARIVLVLKTDGTIGCYKNTYGPTWN